MEGPHGQVVGTAVVKGKLLGEIFERIERVAGIEPLLVLPVAALDLAIVAGREGRMSLWRMPSWAAVFSNSVGRPRLLPENRLVN